MPLHQYSKEVFIGRYAVQLIRKAIKSIRLSIQHPDAKIKLTAPFNIDEKIITTFATSKLHWIEKQLTKFRNYAPRPSVKYMTGETHYFRGAPHPLLVFKGKTSPKVILDEQGNIRLAAGEKTRIVDRKKALANWYRADLNHRASILIGKWCVVMNVQPSKLIIRQMRARWGSCHVRTGKIVLNLELAKRSDRCLELVVVHELAHLLEARHSKRFYALMSQFLPEWESYQRELFSPLP
jgi:predicted metal-dependent hydrolase